MISNYTAQNVSKKKINKIETGKLAWISKNYKFFNADNAIKTYSSDWHNILILIMIILF
jgi:hypothetical protein